MNSIGSDDEAFLISIANARSLLEGMPVAVFVIGADRRVAHWNRACEAITGIRGFDVMGTDLQWKGFYSEPRPVLADLILSGAEDRGRMLYDAKFKISETIPDAYEAEGFFPTMGYSGKWLSFTAALIRGGDGRVLGAIETLQDVTERKIAENALLSHAEALCDDKAKLKGEVEFASKTAFAAMSSLGDMGILLDCLRKIACAESEAAIAEACCASIADYGLGGSVRIRTRDLDFVKNSGGSEIAAAAFNSMETMERIVSFRDRLCVSYESAAIIVSGVPADEDKSGRIRDNIALLAQAASSAAESLTNAREARSKDATLGVALAEARKMAVELESKQKRSLMDSELAMERMSKRLEEMFVSLGLTQGQEESLLDLAKEGFEDILAAQDDQWAVRSQLERMAAALAGK